MVFGILKHRMQSNHCPRGRSGRLSERMWRSGRGSFDDRVSTEHQPETAFPTIAFPTRNRFSMFDMWLSIILVVALDRAFDYRLSTKMQKGGSERNHCQNVFGTQRMTFVNNICDLRYPLRTLVPSCGASPSTLPRGTRRRCVVMIHHIHLFPTCVTFNRCRSSPIHMPNQPYRQYGHADHHIIHKFIYIHKGISLQTIHPSCTLPHHQANSIIGKLLKKRTAGRTLRQPGSRLPIVDCRLSIADCRLSIVDCRLSVIDCTLSIADCRSSIVDCRSSILRRGHAEPIGFRIEVHAERPQCHPEGKMVILQLVTNYKIFQIKQQAITTGNTKRQ